MVGTVVLCTSNDLPGGLCPGGTMDAGGEVNIGGWLLPPEAFGCVCVCGCGWVGEWACVCVCEGGGYVCILASMESIDVYTNIHTVNVCGCDSTVYTVYTNVHACTVYMYRNYKCTSIKGISLGSVSTMSGSGSGSVGVDGRLKQECMKSLMVYIIP